MRDSRRPKPRAEDNPIREVPLSQLRESDRLRLRHPPYPGIDELAEEIRARGQTTPMFVQPYEHSLYTLISGYRRKAALERLGAKTALVRIFHLDDEAAYDLAVSENQHRDALSELERAEVCLRLSEAGRTQIEIAKQMGWSADQHVRRYLRLAREATAPLRDELQKRTISLRAAMVFLNHGLDLPEEQQRVVLEDAALRQISSHELQRELQRLKRAATKRVLPKREPLKTLKNGGFIVRTMRLDADHPSGVYHGIDVLKAALRKARRLEKRITTARADSATPSAEETAE